MAVRFFKTLNGVLTQGIKGACRTRKINEDAAIELVRYYLDANTYAYYSDDPQLQYNDPLCRIAYLYAYVGAHANLVDNALLYFDPLSSIVRKKIRSGGVLEVCSLGGGPGSELLGFVKFIDRICDPEDRIDLRFTLIDKVQEWDESWNALVNGLEENFTEDYGSSRRDWPIVVHRSFLSQDLLQIRSFRQYTTRFEEVDIFVLNHTVSELMANMADFSKVFELLVDQARDGTLFLVIDRNQVEVVNAVNNILQHIELEEVGDLYYQRSTMDMEEQKSHLGQWYERIGRSPKLTWNVFYGLARKRELPF